MQENFDNLLIREIDKNDVVARFSLGKKEHQPLKNFLQKSAKDYHCTNVAKTYVIVDQANPPHVWGYMSLMCSEISLDGGQKPAENQSFERYREFPAIKIVRLAVDKKLQGRSYGSVLINTAIAIAKDMVMPNVGCRFLIVDSKPGSIEFYEKRGFSLLADAENKKTANPLMLLDLHNLK